MKQSDRMVLRCQVQAPEVFVPRARYALEALLQPLNVQPTWVDDQPTLYYGTDAASAQAPLRMALHADTLEYFASGARYDGRRAIRTDGPLVLLGTPEEPDWIASAFFLLSGWDEHVTVERDEHARFCYRFSALKDLEVVTDPLVDRYRLLLRDRLQAAGVVTRQRDWSGRGWALMPTFDVDYLRQWRPGTILARGLRRPHAVLHSFLTGSDAYLDGVHNLLAALTAQEAEGTFFFKATDRSAYDPAYRRPDRVVRHVLAMVREQGSAIGLHPGYYGSTHATYIRDERERLERLAEMPIQFVRQHYLRYEQPWTSRLHVAEGFSIDSTLGYPDHEGFRRGTCHPFRIFDIPRNTPLDVWELPLCLMDSAMVARRGLSPEASTRVLRTLMETCRSVGGACVVLWHNILWDRGMEGWPEVLEETLRFAREEGAWIGPLRT